jgi:aminoglycoside phosphotransferase (APT) family kinase protein
VDKADVTPALVSELVAAQFPQWADLAVTRVQADGWDNTTFRLGDELSVRLPSGDSYVAQVEKEQRWLPALAPHLPLRIPEPVARGEPSAAFPRPWSVRRWLDGEPATVENVEDLERFAVDLANFLAALYRVPVDDDGPPGGAADIRGGPITALDAQCRAAIRALDGVVDTARATEVWDAALRAPFHGPPVWVHGDVSASNLLVVDGELSAVIDFGCAAVRDPACDLMIAWTFFDGGSRSAFRDALRLDDDTWARGRGWMLWKALLVLRDAMDEGGTQPHWRAMGWRKDASAIIEDVLAERSSTRSRRVRARMPPS